MENSNEIAIELKNVSKCYRKYAKPIDRLKDVFLSHKEYGEVFWALQNINLTIPRGQATGIIGRNGAGKSTLLRIISSTLSPTKGEVVVNGKVAALLELGSGFNLEFTGRENVFLNGQLLGLTRQQIEAKLDAIIDFSEVGEFLDQPVKTYSSGMKVRLAFAVYVAIEPDILIIDEALSVGDIFFRQKCYRRMEELLEKNTTILFISHNMSAIRNFCQKTFLLHQGTVLFSGPSDQAVARFNKLKNKMSGQINSVKPNQKDKSNLSADRDKAKEISLPKQVDVGPAVKKILNSALWADGSFEDQTLENKIIAVAVVDRMGNESMQVAIGDKLTFQVLFAAPLVDEAHITFSLKDKYDKVIFNGGSYYSDLLPISTRDAKINCFEFSLTLNVSAGSYTFLFSLDEPGMIPNKNNRLSASPWLGPIDVTFDYRAQKAPFLGPFGLPCTSQFKQLAQLNERT